MIDPSPVPILEPDDPSLDGLIRVLPPKGGEDVWLAEHLELLGPEPQVNRFQKQGMDEPAFDVIEVHPESPQLTVAPDSDLLVAIFPVGWEPGHAERPLFAVRVPAGSGSVIEPGVWHSGVIAVDETPVMAAFRPRTLEDATDVHHLARPVALAAEASGS